ncbi:endolytic transglycosylase MltG [Zhouia amylolytica]|uniref:Endolytic murein transglycosylase n=1 Tax=Zhouia amylolytica AD3 TaxID=1286632 RepID=W2UNY9_9FLAO|nr:endolytic transglycosylase MltG [Zhouia amylolytica]ETN95664.1 periplasmic protein [Zhouia amylolytica AD3]
MYIRKILVVMALVGVIVGGAIVYNIYSAIFSPNTQFNNEVAYVYIPTNASFKDVKEQLKPLLKSVNSFEDVADKKGYINNIKAGKYGIEKGMNNNDIINTLRSNNIPINVTFNNQETLEKLAGRIASQIEADSLSLVNALTDKDFLTTNNLSDDTALVPYIPNSYEFFWNTSADEFRDRMLKEYERFWNDDRSNKAAKLNLSKEEVISLAAIVQKETAKVDERPRVAGVYLNRIRRSMPLQADPTVIYAIKKHQNNFDTVIKRVLYKDLELDSPYNTYKYAGIPPGPITMPDISSIDAVLNSEQHNYLYFVADTKNFGYHKFAKTLAQHNVNKQQYVRWLNSQKINR